VRLPPRLGAQRRVAPTVVAEEARLESTLLIEERTGEGMWDTSIRVGS